MSQDISNEFYNVKKLAQKKNKKVYDNNLIKVYENNLHSFNEGWSVCKSLFAGFVKIMGSPIETN